MFLLEPLYLVIKRENMDNFPKMIIGDLHDIVKKEAFLTIIFYAVTISFTIKILLTLI